ncbi:MAG: DUF1847 domain-containing protein [Candidatus Adiutrix sp.]|jgi:uncharacterized metal-binding protein|nr:DUF1847 domain-containing protein [Candidatus Adiutrix sp.]
MSEKTFSCADCGVQACKSAQADKYPQFCPTKNIDPKLVEGSLARYAANEEAKNLVGVSSVLEAEFYCKLCRVEETIEFIKRMGYKKIGLATCVGLLRETKIFAKILRDNNIDYFAACCKTGAVDKETLGLTPEQKINGGCGHESMCNPLLQADVLAREGTDFNVVIGLCVGHDSLFLKNSQAPVTVMIVKDRVMGHNPVAALYAAEGIYSRFTDVSKSWKTPAKE